MLNTLALGFIVAFAALAVLGHYFLFTALIYGKEDLPVRSTRKAKPVGRTVRTAAAR